MNGAVSNERLLGVDQGPAVVGRGAEVREQGAVAGQGGGVSADEMLTKRELAVRLRIGVRTVERWQRRGILCYVKVGKVVLFHWGDVVAHLKGNYLVSRRSLRIRRAVVWGSDQSSVTSDQGRMAEV
jgi:excisionase family DNA binding protein